MKSAHRELLSGPQPKCWMHAFPAEKAFSQLCPTGCWAGTHFPQPRDTLAVLPQSPRLVPHHKREAATLRMVQILSQLLSFLQDSLLRASSTGREGGTVHGDTVPWAETGVRDWVREQVKKQLWDTPNLPELQQNAVPQPIEQDPPSQKLPGSLMQAMGS